METLREDAVVKSAAQEERYLAAADSWAKEKLVFEQQVKKTRIQMETLELEKERSSVESTDEVRKEISGLKAQN